MDKDVVVKEYIFKVITEYKTGQAREHSYRPALKQLFESVIKLQAINDPKQSEHGAPDFVLMRSKELSAGYVEAKDVDVNLDDAEKSEQMHRYLEYGSLILTNYLEFRFFKHGKRYGEPTIIAVIKNGEIVPDERKFDDLQGEIKTFLTETESITSSAKLAKIMGDKARRIRNKVYEYVSDPNERNGELRRIFESFKQLLIHDIKEEQFADMYAQTLVYGLFTARYEDETPQNFSRQEARELIPPSNPFLRGFFDHIAGANFDIRLAIIVNELCEVFQNADVNDLMNQYVTQKGLLGEDKESADPVVHFYEDFLKEYDAEQRKKLGAFYTPLPVVRFIVRAVDSILEKDFGLAGGLSDTAKIEVSKTSQGKTAKETLHRVQILDPAVGTGTFLNEVVRKIHGRFGAGQQGRWPTYVHHDLLPRLHGFELMMAPYTIAHLKMSMILKETGFKYFNNTRLGIYLTNSLEESSLQPGMLSFGLAENIAEESKAASKIKNDTPIMVVIGNPPYSVSSSNKGEWIQNLIKDYKKDLGERKINLDDDYIKFIRFAEHFIETNKTGIVAMITNNSFIDGITHRQMRKHLLETFDEIYIFDLHGNSKKKEKALDGGKDENVFNIMQGVSISIFVRKNENKEKLGTVYHSELFGKREKKFEMLNKSDIEKIKWQKLDCPEPYYFFVPKDFGLEGEYKKGFGLEKLFSNYNSGIQTKNDDITINFDELKMQQVVDDFLHSDLLELKQKYSVNDDGVWKASQAQADLKLGDYKLTSLLYRPFDIRYTAITPRSSGFLARPRMKTSEHLLQPNLALLFSRSIPEQRNFSEIFLSNQIVDLHAAAGQTYCAPLYLYSEDGSKIPNLKKEIVAEIEKIVGKATPEDIFDYVYSVLHSPSYREKYKEFLKIDFPRVPYPKDEKTFWQLVELGRELRELHLLELPKVNTLLTTYEISGDNKIEEIRKEGNKIYINDRQYFGGVPDIAWNFYIGGYQPAQKWLKDRKGRTLSNSDIEHYQKIIVALVETENIMKQIDRLGIDK